MKVKELVSILNDCKQDADVIICYEHNEKGKKAQCYYKQVDDIGYQQILNKNKNKLEVNENLLMIWGE